MAPRPPSPLLLAAFFCACASVLAEDSARDLRNQALGDLRAVQQAPPPPPLRPHIDQAVRALERIPADAFTDGNHVRKEVGEDVFDRLRQATQAVTQAGREAWRSGDRALAERLRADADRLARAARLLAAILAGDLRTRTLIIDRESAEDRDEGLREADQELQRGDQDLATQDPSIRSLPWFRLDTAINRFKDSWKEAQEAARFELALVSASVAPIVFSPNGDGRRERTSLSLLYLIRPEEEARVVRTRWTIRTGPPPGVEVRLLTLETRVAGEQDDEDETPRDLCVTRTPPASLLVRTAGSRSASARPSARLRDRHLRAARSRACPTPEMSSIAPR